MKMKIKDNEILASAPSEFSHYNPKVNEFTSITDGVRLVDDMRIISQLENKNAKIFGLLDDHQNHKLETDAELQELRERVVEVEYALALTRPILRSFQTVTIPAVSKTLKLVEITLNKKGGEQ